MNTRISKSDDCLEVKRGCEPPTTRHKLSTTLGDTCGFSLVELIVVMVMIGILTAIALPTYSYIVSKAKVSRVEADIRTLEKDITAYLIDKGSLPPSLNAIGRGDLFDAWKRPYQYVNFSLGGPPYQDFLGPPLNTDFDLYSFGEDGISTQSLADESSKNDIVRAGDGGYVGLGKEF